MRSRYPQPKTPEPARLSALDQPTALVTPQPNSLHKNLDASGAMNLHIAPLFALILAALCTAAPAQTQLPDFATTPGLNAVISEQESFLPPATNRGTGLTTLPFDPGATVTEVVPFDETKMMRTKDLRPGMKGYGLTVFSGIVPERFEAEVVGVRHRAFPGDDMILCILSSPYLQDIGVFAGMSGSPVFMEDKLIGAVAYGWGFTDEPLAGITPIESMLSVFNSTSPAIREPGSPAPGGQTFNAYEAYWEVRRKMSLEPLRRLGGALPVAVEAQDFSDSVRAKHSLPDQFTMIPLSTPLFVSTVSPATMRVVETLFGGTNVQPLATGGSSSGALPAAATAENSPGGPVPDLQALAADVSGGYGLAIPLVEGDLSMAGVGTVTYRYGDKLVAFGHPMFEGGLVSYPMAPARVNALVRSRMRPFKLGEALGKIGTVYQDRLPAIGGVFGAVPRSYEMKTLISDPAYRGLREFNFSIWNDKEMGPMLGMSALMEAISGAARGSGDTVALYKYTLRMDDGTELIKEDYTVDPFGGYGVAMNVISDMGVLINNPYKPVLADTLDFQMQIADRYPQAQIQSVDLDQPSYRPGAEVKVTWRMQPYRKELTEMSHTFRLPDNISEGDYELTVCDANVRARIEASRNPGGERVIDYESLLRVIQRNFPRNKVYVTLQDRDTGVAVKGSELPKLPSSIIETIRSTTEAPYVSSVSGNMLLDVDYATNFEVSGIQRESVRVTRRP
jgi:hypothetical protein